MAYGTRKLRQQKKTLVQITNYPVTPIGHTTDRSTIAKLIDVYRFEVPIGGPFNRGHGPFTADCHDRSLTSLCSKYRRSFVGAPKTPEEDGCGRPPRWHEVCGTTNLEDLMYGWLPRRELLRQMSEAGFTINHYQVDEAHIHYGNSQCFWEEKEATLIGPIGIGTALAQLYDDVC